MNLLGTPEVLLLSPLPLPSVTLMHVCNIVCHTYEEKWAENNLERGETHG